MIGERTSIVAVLCLLATLCLVTATVAQGQNPNRAALVVSLADGELVAQCVEFEEDELTGYELLNRSGLSVDASVTGAGVTVCSIEGSGCPVDDCFCKCKGGPDCLYWSYWHGAEDEWRYSQAGAAVYPVRDGAVEGWVWGIGSPNEATAPPTFTFDQICSPESPAAQPAGPQAGSAASATASEQPGTAGETAGMVTSADTEQQGAGQQASADRATGPILFALALFVLLAAAGTFYLRGQKSRGTGA